MKEQAKKIFSVASFTFLAIMTMGNEQCGTNVATTHDTTHTVTAPVCFDDDGDGYGLNCAAGADCDDSLETGAACHTGCPSFSYDNDGDGYGNALTTTVQCEALPGQIAEVTDCDDFSPLAALTFPGAATLEGNACMRDLDGDGYGNPDVEEPVEPGTDCDDSFSTIHQECGEAVLPGGCFEMGDNFDEGAANEIPVHSVCLSSFTMDVYEVTNAEFEACVFSGGCEAPLNPSSETHENYYGYPEFASYPVVNVSYTDATDYCEWIGGRLPTEAEWEYAASSGRDDIRYPFGNEALIGLANLNGLFDDADTTAVGSYVPNDFGLRDMAGNVWEWANDYYDENYYATSPEDNPTGPTAGIHRVIRGGGYSSFSYFARVSYRNHYYENLELNSLGFRCAR